MRSMAQRPGSTAFVPGDIHPWALDPVAPRGPMPATGGPAWPRPSATTRSRGSCVLPKGGLVHFPGIEPDPVSASSAEAEAVLRPGCIVVDLRVIALMLLHDRRDCGCAHGRRIVLRSKYSMAEQQAGGCFPRGQMIPAMRRRPSRGSLAHFSPAGTCARDPALPGECGPAGHRHRSRPGIRLDCRGASLPLPHEDADASPTPAAPARSRRPVPTAATISRCCRPRVNRSSSIRNPDALPFSANCYPLSLRLNRPENRGHPLA